MNVVDHPLPHSTALACDATLPERGRSTLPHQPGNQDLVRYLAEFGLTLADLDPEQVLMFVAARNAARYLLQLEIPVALPREQQPGSGLRELESETRRRAATYFDDYLPAHVPDDQMGIGLIQGVEDLPRIFPTQWLLEEVCPPAFYAKLADNELFMPRWEQPTGNPQGGDDDARQWQLLDELAAAQATRHHAYVLLDTSRSMNDRDRRGTVARGLALAFLLHGHDRQAWLHVRPFAARVSELSSGAGNADFQAIARRVVELPNAGQTRIQFALEQATADVRTAGPCRRADILLITDGMSRLTRNPMVGERLHTFVLGNLPKKDRVSGAIATLKAWSQTFQHLWQHEFAETLIPRAGDVRAATAVLEHALAHSTDLSDPAAADRLRRIADNVQALLAEFDRLGNPGTLSPEVREDVRRQLKRASQLLAGQSAPGSAKRPGRSAHRDAWDRLPRLVLGGLAAGFGDRVLFWRYLRQLLQHLVQWLADVPRRRMRRLDARFRRPSGRPPDTA
jgi:plasmid stabilization system protein ParE